MNKSAVVAVPLYDYMVNIGASDEAIGQLCLLTEALKALTVFCVGHGYSDYARVVKAQQAIAKSEGRV